jgi:hypothetical protein
VRATTRRGAVELRGPYRFEEFNVEQRTATYDIALDLAAAAVYALEGDGRRVVYWLAAAILTAAVTF